MANKVNLWNLYKLAKTWVVRPSDLLNVKDDYIAFCIDEAVATFGDEIEAELQDARDDAKTKAQALLAQQQVLSRYIGIRPKYRDPVARMKKVQEDG